MIDDLKDTIEKIAESSLNINLLGRQWNDTKNKVDGLLLSGKRNVEEVKKLCDELYVLPFQERKEFITRHFGPKYLDKVLPLLLQLESIEVHFNK